MTLLISRCLSHLWSASARDEETTPCEAIPTLLAPYHSILLSSCARNHCSHFWVIFWSFARTILAVTTPWQHCRQLIHLLFCLFVQSDNWALPVMTTITNKIQKKLRYFVYHVRDTLYGLLPRKKNTRRISIDVRKSIVDVFWHCLVVVLVAFGWYEEEPGKQGRRPSRAVAGNGNGSIVPSFHA